MDVIGKMLFRAAGGDWKRYFWMRQAWHLTGGVVIGLLTTLIHPNWVTFLVWSIMLGVLIIKEMAEDGVTQTRTKTVIDMISWNVGFWCVAWVNFR